MRHPAEYALAASMLWTALLLTAQLLLAFGKGRTDLSRPAGSAWKGLVYIFTTAMLPSHKETVRLHKLEFSIGLLMHLGAFAAIVSSFALLLFPSRMILPFALTLPLFAVPAACGLYLFVRRLRTPNLRAMSTPDDYISVLVTVHAIAVAALFEIQVISRPMAALLFVPLYFYLPLGKLRHALFFFLARANYGLRLGYRGVYPVHSSENRSGNAN